MKASTAHALRPGYYEANTRNPSSILYANDL